MNCYCEKDKGIFYTAFLEGCNLRYKKVRYWVDNEDKLHFLANIKIPKNIFSCILKAHRELKEREKIFSEFYDEQKREDARKHAEDAFDAGAIDMVHPWGTNPRIA